MELFPDFGRYNLYVWLSYGISIAVLLAFSVHTLAQNARRKK
ncbi:MAG: heme exporter protein CcmD [Robiginitomaculum sp.]|nr:MAG: heme exporter protein CcmD [Robiginitomaculum sp.]